MRAAILLAALAACTPTGPSAYELLKYEPREDTITGLLDELLGYAAAHDDRGLAHMLATPLGYGGMWFAGSDCRRKFAAAGTVSEAAIDDFARCLSGLDLRRGARRHPYPDVVVLTYGAGIEVEALLDPSDGGHLRWIGFAGRRELRDALPTVTQDAFMARAAPLPPLTLDAATRVEIDRELALHPARANPGQPPAPAVYAWLKICVDVTGAVTGVHARQTSSIAAQDAFVAWARTWTFQPIALGDQASPACAVVLVDEHGPATGLPLPPPVPSDLPDAVLLPPDAFGDRLAGAALPAPDRGALERLAKEGRTADVIARVFYCLDEIGQVDVAVVMRSSGLADHDRELGEAVRAWRFAPYVVRGAPVRACSEATVATPIPRR